MATTTKPRKVIFSFAAYAKEVISVLNETVTITEGLKPSEIATIESTASFTFPPDLRSILAEGLPVGPGFPNWRSSSRHQLCLLSSLPVLSLVKEVSRGNFWSDAWGPRPRHDEDAVAVAKEFLGNVPRLVPVFRHCYVPCEPSLAGNPVIYVHGGEIQILSLDVGDFYKTPQFWKSDDKLLHRNNNTLTKTARRVSFWTEAAENNDTRQRRGRWWRGELGECMEEVTWRLREGGWCEDDVREMMMMDGGGGGGGDVRHVSGGKEGVVRHVRGLSIELLKGGWSVNDVVYSLGDIVGKGGGDNVNGGFVDGESNWVDIHCHSAKDNSPVLSR
ncbi:uncharacterized protein LOC141631527 [Silene latifolia]|uniref:uncharacterized protein LOC141631527 n=1 Tax=Silene latifolia TaxID=37657 RepID=UPI003D7782F3